MPAEPRAVNTPAAPVWVLLRGWARGQDHWGDFPARLQAAWPGARVITPDLPGNGRRRAERSPTRVADLTDDLRAQVRLHMRMQGLPPDPVHTRAQQQRPAPVHLLALSMGAMVACDWAHRHPGEVARLALLNTSLRRFSPWHHRLQPGALWRLLGCLARKADASTWEHTILALTAHRPRQPVALLADWTRLREQQPVQAANLWRQLWAAARHAGPAGRPPVPLLLLASRQDQLVNVCCSQALARAWQAPLRVHPWAGHDLPLDDPDWVLRQLGAPAVGHRGGER